MAKRKQADLFGNAVSESLKTAPCVESIRYGVEAWRAGGYEGVTDATRSLLNYWFFREHRLHNGALFKFNPAQRSAIETLIYVYEVQKVRTRKELIDRFAMRQVAAKLRLPYHDEFARYATKMATGTGKTVLMALVITWQYANAMRYYEGYAKTFLILAPNVIVFERLMTDFANGAIFKKFPIIPKHLLDFWDMAYYMRGEPERGGSEAGLYLANIQQFYEREDRAVTQETNIMTEMLGPAPPKEKQQYSDFYERIAKREGLAMVLNDEAHHTHDENNQWNGFIRRLHAARPLAMQLDVTATPRFNNGTLFPWVISDYSLRQAIEDKLVKRPIKGIAKIDEAPSDDAPTRYEGFLVAAVERWREYFAQLERFGKKPVLFIMMNSTEEAEAVGDWLRRKYPDCFKDNQILVIHTDTKGEISKKDLEVARIAAKEVDSPDSPINAIVSVLMLKEGWDVQNVTVVVGLRPYSSKAQILPEQAIGRGLRLMFRGLDGGYTERVDIIGNAAFMKFIEELEKTEEIELDSYTVGKDKLNIFYIQPVPEKADKDIGIPEISAFIARKSSIAAELAKIDVMTLPTLSIEIGEGNTADLTFKYEGKDILTNEKLIEKEYFLPKVKTPEEVIGYVSRLIAQRVHLPSHFHAIAPLVKRYFEQRLFNQAVDLQQEKVLRKISNPMVIRFTVHTVFEKVVKPLVVEDKTPQVINKARYFKDLPPYPTSKELYEAGKTIFNFVACDNKYEKAFAQFLENAEDVYAFAKLPLHFGFSITYTDANMNIRLYYPDFVVRLMNGEHWIIETKGQEDVNVVTKDQAAENWCAHVQSLIGEKWSYLKVLQEDFNRFQPNRFAELKLM